MIIPVRCFGCNRPVAHLWENYKERVKNGEDKKSVLDAIGLKRYCCRALFLGHVDLVETVARFRKSQMVDIYEGDSTDPKTVRGVRPSSESGPFRAVEKCRRAPEGDKKQARFSGEFNEREYVMLIVRGKSAASVRQELKDMALYYQGVSGNKERLERFLSEDIALLRSQLEIYQKNPHLVERALVESVPNYRLELNALEAKIKNAISKLSGPIEHLYPGRKIARARIYGLENNLNSEE